MKELKITKKIKYFEEKCPNCGKIIRGTSESQVNYNLKLHKEKCDKKWKN
jgi:predicted RNA-binding Zn-ribbon protein involved in translation (DUF1610 family)